jgi:hypothetical protein
MVSGLCSLLITEWDQLGSCHRAAGSWLGRFSWAEGGPIGTSVCCIASSGWKSQRVQGPEQMWVFWAAWQQWCHWKYLIYEAHTVVPNSSPRYLTCWGIWLKFEPAWASECVTALKNMIVPCVFVSLCIVSNSRIYELLFYLTLWMCTSMQDNIKSSPLYSRGSTR